MPIHVEAVTGIVGRAELLVASLVFLAALLFRRATDGPRLGAWPYAGALVAFLLAVFTKENAVVLPGVVVLGELLRRDVDEPLGSRLRRKGLAFAGLLVPILALAAVRLFAMGGLVSKKEAFFDLDNPLAPLPHLLRAANGLWLLLRYVAKTFVPLGLVADHSAHALDLVTSLSDPRAGAGLAAVLGLAAAGLAALRRHPLVSLGIAFFLGTILPTSNVFFPIGTIYGDRLAYLPSAGLLAAAAGLVAALPVLSSGFRAAVLCVLLATYAGATVARNEVFRDDERLFDEMVEKVPRSARAWYNVASVAGARGEMVAARASLEKAVALFPRYYDAWAFLALVARKEGRWDDARVFYRRALTLKPDYEIGWQGLARAEEESGRLAEAEQTCADRAPAPSALRAARFSNERRFSTPSAGSKRPVRPGEKRSRRTAGARALTPAWRRPCRPSGGNRRRCPRHAGLSRWRPGGATRASSWRNATRSGETSSPPPPSSGAPCAEPRATRSPPVSSWSSAPARRRRGESCRPSFPGSRGSSGAPRGISRCEPPSRRIGPRPARSLASLSLRSRAGSRPHAPAGFEGREPG